MQTFNNNKFNKLCYTEWSEPEPLKKNTAPAPAPTLKKNTAPAPTKTLRLRLRNPDFYIAIMISFYMSYEKNNNSFCLDISDRPKVYIKYKSKVIIQLTRHIKISIINNDISCCLPNHCKRLCSTRITLIKQTGKADSNALKYA